MFNKDLTKLYWASSVTSRHSLNILRTGQAFIVLYEANESGGLYIRATNGQIVTGEELDYATNHDNQLRGKTFANYPLGIDFYSNESRQRLWSVDIEQFWIYDNTKDAKGTIIHDRRIEISKDNLA